MAPSGCGSRGMSVEKKLQQKEFVVYPEGLPRVKSLGSTQVVVAEMA
jgi:hypothetical protein